MKECHGIDDREIKACVDWCIDLIGSKEWEKRKQQAISFYEKVRNKPFFTDVTKSFIPTSDIAGWYLYLSFCYLDDVSRYDMMQGGRIIPIFKIIGRDIDKIKKIKNVEKRLKRALSKNSQEIDSCFFEILVANLYKRNGWEEVAFLSEESSKKTPDILAKKKDIELYIECKRKSKISDYSIKEKEKWLMLFRPVSEFLKDERKSMLLDIVFHQELQTIPSDYLKKVLIPKIPLSTYGILIDNEICTIQLKQIFLDKLREHLKKHSVRLDGSLFAHLLFGYDEFYRGVTSGVYAKLNPTKPIYIDDLEWAYAAIWHCDSEEALFKKARSIKKQFSNAIDQVPCGSPSSIHFGIEVYDGESVELIRLKKIMSDLYNFDTKGKNAQYLYFHMLAFTVPPDMNWDVHEDCVYFRKSDVTADCFLGNKLLLADKNL